MLAPETKRVLAGEGVVLCALPDALQLLVSQGRYALGEVAFAMRKQNPDRRIAPNMAHAHSLNSRYWITAGSGSRRSDTLRQIGVDPRLRHAGADSSHNRSPSGRCRRSRSSDAPPPRAAACSSRSPPRAPSQAPRRARSRGRISGTVAARRHCDYLPGPALVAELVGHLLKDSHLLRQSLTTISRDDTG